MCVSCFEFRCFASFLDGVVVLYGLRYGQVPFQSEDHCHEDGGQDRDGLDLVAEVGERVHVPVAERPDVLAHRWKRNVCSLRLATLKLEKVSNLFHC